MVRTGPQCSVQTRVTIPITYLEKEGKSTPSFRRRIGAVSSANATTPLLLFLYNSGARASEAVRVAIEDLTWDSTGTGSVKIHGKGRKIRFCPLWKKDDG